MWIRKICWIFSLLACFSCWVNPLLAQVPNLKFERIMSEDGLPQNTIHGIVKDKYGFMWFGTWGGLCRYDGYTFKVYRYNPSDSKSINNNRIHNIIKDADQNIWVLTFQENEVCRYNYERDNFERIPSGDVSPALLDLLSRRKHVETVSFSYQQYSWTLDGSSNSLVQSDKVTNTRKTYSYNPANVWSLSDSYVSDIYKDDHNIFWVGTFSNGISKANLEAKPFEYYYHNPSDANSIIDNNVRALCEDKEGNLWVGTRDRGITVISRGKYRHITHRPGKPNTINDNQIKRIFCDSRGIMWIGTKKGLNSYNPRTNTFREFTGLNLGNTTVYGITEDKEHNLWFASWKGIYKYIPHKDKLLHFDPSTTLKNRHARVILQDKRGQLWVGTEGGGITVVKPVREDSIVVVKHLQHNRSLKNSISDNRINCIYEDSAGFIWIGSGNGLDRYDPTHDKMMHFPAQSGLNEATVAGMLEDDNGYIWISHKNGIAQLDKKSLAVRNYTRQDGLQSNEFWDAAILKSPYQNKMFFGGNNGLNAFNPDSIRPDKTLPRTVLTELQILNHKIGVNEEVGGRVVLSKPLYLTDEITLTYNDKSVAIEFAGLHYSNPKQNKYAYKLEGFDKDWVYTDAGSRVAKYSNLAAGDYVLKVMSSNSDGVWNRTPATLGITVKPPFWASNWAYLLYALIFIIIVLIYHRYSTRYARLQAKLSYEQLVREKENELHQNKLQFFTNISHEIKTPLTLILAPLEKLAQMLRENNPVSSQLVTMKSNGERLLKLVNELLDFRKLETGNTGLQLTEKDIIIFLKGFADTFQALAEKKNIRLEFISPVQSFRFFYDEDKLEKVMSNLLSNALKFSSDGAWVKLEFAVEGDALQEPVMIRVSNLGTGIPEVEQERIFEPFQQASGNREGGTGLGLALSKGLIELHGGKISVASRPAEAGMSETSFTMWLPLNTDAEKSGLLPFPPGLSIAGEQLSVPEGVSSQVLLPEKTDSKQERVLINGKVPVILVVEDNPELREYLRSHFEEQYQVLEARNGAEGIEIAMQQLPDLIVSDVMMPQMDGIEFCKRIKSEFKTGHIPVILLTAKALEEHRIEGIETGADDYITKPFNPSFLSAKVKNLLLERNRLKERYRKEISLEPSEEVPLSPDEKLLKNLLGYVEERMADPSLSVEDICTKVGISRTQLYRKIKAMTGLSMAEVLKEIRLKRAKQLLKDRKFNVNEVSYMVGFSDTDYFRKCFKAEFGVTPSEYYKSHESLGQE